MSNLDVKYLPWQNEVFFTCQKRRRIIHKGRRLGFTQGAAQAACEWMVDGTYNRIMWGDTIASNIDKYISRYFMPLLKQIPESDWHWQKQDRILTIMGNTCDFRSADRPENWEGFGYDLIILNEAGIILRNAYLWDNAVRPMLLDNPQSVAIIGGTPKGKKYKGDTHKFYTLAAQSGDDWQTYQYSTYDNPLLNESDIDEMVAEMPESVVKQEIYGEFLDTDSSVLIDPLLVASAMSRRHHVGSYRHMPMVMGVDVGWSSDPTVATFRQGDHVYPQIEVEPTRNDMITAARVAKLIQQYKPAMVNIDYGYGTGVVSALRGMGFSVNGINFGESALDNGKYANRRAEMHDEARQWLINGSLPDSGKLEADLTAIGFGEDSKGRLLLEKKEAIKAVLGRSPDYGDSFVLTFALPAISLDTVIPYDQMTMAERDFAVITGTQQHGGDIADPLGGMFD